MENKQKIKSIIEIVVTVIVAVSLALVLRTYVFGGAQVCGPSMLNTLYGGGEPVYDATSNGYIYENGDMLLLVKNSKFKAGDIIVFMRESFVSVPDSEANEKFLVKRVIGVGGDIVKIYDNDGTAEVYVNGIKLEESFLKESMKFPDNLSDWKAFKELHYDVELNMNYVEYKVSKNCVFVMGDNRNISSDSRMNGEVDISDKVRILGKAVLAYNTTSEHRTLKFL